MLGVEATVTTLMLGMQATVKTLAFVFEIVFFVFFFH